MRVSDSRSRVRMIKRRAAISWKSSVAVSISVAWVRMRVAVVRMIVQRRWSWYTSIAVAIGWMRMRVSDSRSRVRMRVAVVRIVVRRRWSRGEIWDIRKRYWYNRGSLLATLLATLLRLIIDKTSIAMGIISTGFRAINSDRTAVSASSVVNVVGNQPITILVLPIAIDREYKVWVVSRVGTTGNWAIGNYDRI